MAKVVAIIFVLLFSFKLSVQHLQQLPTIENEAGVHDFIEEIISIFVKMLNVEGVPEYAKEDGRDIISELRDELVDCKTALSSTHSLTEFRGCVHQQIEDAKDQLWEFKENLNESSSTKVSLHVLLIPFMIIIKIFH